MPAITVAANVRYESGPRVPQLRPIGSEMRSPVAIAGRDALIAKARPLELERLGREAELQA